MDWKYPTAFSSWGDEEKAAIERVLASGNFTQGEEVAAFEAEFAAFHGRKYAIMVNSGSSANLVATAALQQMDYFRRDETALVPALAWSTTYAPLVQHGLKLQLVDVDETWNADPNNFRVANDDISVVVLCSILGNAGHLAEWKNVAGVMDAAVLEDNCESLGAYTADKKLCGTFGDVSTFSLFWSHQIGAIEGGVILTDDEQIEILCRMLRAHGWTRDVANRIDSPPRFAYEYSFGLFGYNVRSLELHAAIARAQLRKLPAMIQRRLDNADYFFAEVINSGLPVSLPIANGRMSPFGIQFEVPLDQRQNVADALRAAGIDCRLPTGGSFGRHVYGAPWASQRTPNADRIHDCGMFIGNGPLDLRDRIDEAVAVLKRVLI